MSNKQSANNKALATRFFEATVRAEVIIHLGTMCADYTFPDAAESAFYEDAENVWKALGWDGEADDFDAEDISERIRRTGKFGFLVCFATPVPSDFSPDGKSYSTNGWGYYACKWIYAEHFADACEQAIHWAETYIAERRQKELLK